MTFVIEKNIPIAQKRRGPKYPFAQMENGDSFLVPLNGREAKSVASGLHSQARAHNVRISTRTGADHVRVWKIDTLINND